MSVCVRVCLFVRVPVRVCVCAAWVGLCSQGQAETVRVDMLKRLPPLSVIAEISDEDSGGSGCV